MKKAFVFVFGILAVVSLACGFNLSTANIADAKLATDPDGNNPTTTFEQDAVFYAVVNLANAPEDTAVKAVWIAVDADGVDPNMVIDEVELTSDSGVLQFNLTNDKLWPAGNYKVDLYLNGELDRSLDFKVEGEVVAAEPTPTLEPEPEPTATPTPEPTEPPPATATPKVSAGDTLGGARDSVEEPTDMPDQPAEAEPLPLGAEPYEHPSGAFSFGVPQPWELYSEDELSAAFGDNLSRFGVVFVNTAGVYNEKEMKGFINDSLDIMVDTFADEYEVVAENNKLAENNLYYVGIEFSEGDGNADFFFEQYDSTIFIFYFTSLDYVNMLPTRDAVLDTYTINVEAAAAVATAEEPAAPPPTATPPPVPANPFVPPAGVARVYLQNEYPNEYNIDFGDGAGSIKVMPGAQNFYHDVPPGKYRPGLSLPGGGAANVEFEIQPNQAYLIIVTGDAGVKYGQVYP